MSCVSYIKAGSWPLGHPKNYVCIYGWIRCWSKCLLLLRVSDPCAAPGEILLASAPETKERDEKCVWCALLYRLTHFVCAVEREKGDKIRRLDYYHARNIGVTSGDVSLIYYYVHLIWFPVKEMIYIKFGFLYYIYRSLYDDVIGRLHSSLVSTGLDDGFPIWGSSLCCLNSPIFLFSPPVLYTYWMNFVWSMPTVGAGQ